MSWDRWCGIFEDAGFTTLAPGWPDDPETVEDANEHPEVFAHKTVGQIADHFEEVHTSRTRDNELWFLSKERGAKPVKLGRKMSEGAAISKKTLKIAFS